VGIPCYNSDTGEIDKEICEDQTLYLQKELNGNLDIFDGKLVIEPNGTMKLAGSLEVEGTVTAKDVKTTQIVINSPEVESASAGKVTIPSGDKSITVETSAVKENSIIMVTPERPVALGSKYIGEGKFEITLKESEDSNLQVSWFILGSEMSLKEETVEESEQDETDTTQTPIDTAVLVEEEPPVETPVDNLITETPFTPEEEEIMALNP
jgi:hypothetical protein